MNRPKGGTERRRKSMTTLAFTVMWVAVAVTYVLAARDYLTE